MSTLGTALKATGVALLASSAVAAGGIGYGGYKLATSVSSTIDTVKQEIKEGTFKDSINDFVNSCKGSVEVFKKKLEELNIEPGNVNEMMKAVTDLINQSMGKEIVDSSGKVITPPKEGGVISKILAKVLSTFLQL